MMSAARKNQITLQCAHLFYTFLSCSWGILVYFTGNATPAVSVLILLEPVRDLYAPSDHILETKHRNIFTMVWTPFYFYIFWGSHYCKEKLWKVGAVLEILVIWLLHICILTSGTPSFQMVFSSSWGHPHTHCSAPGFPNRLKHFGHTCAVFSEVFKKLAQRNLKEIVSQAQENQFFRTALGTISDLLLPPVFLSPSSS